MAITGRDNAAATPGITVIPRSAGDDWRDAGASGRIEAGKDAYQTNPLDKSGSNASGDKNKAENVYKSKKESALEADMVVVGDVRLKPNVMVEVKNVGTKYGGKWYIKSVEHTFSGGYTCHLKLTRDAYGTSGGTRDDGAQNSPDNKPGNPDAKPRKYVEISSKTQVMRPK